jgi:hypothetical protein
VGERRKTEEENQDGNCRMNDLISEEMFSRVRARLAWSDTQRNAAATKGAHSAVK